MAACTVADAADMARWLTLVVVLIQSVHVGQSYRDPADDDDDRHHHHPPGNVWTSSRLHRDFVRLWR